MEHRNPTPTASVLLAAATVTRLLCAVLCCVSVLFKARRSES